MSRPDILSKSTLSSLELRWERGFSEPDEISQRALRAAALGLVIVLYGEVRIEEEEHGTGRVGGGGRRVLTSSGAWEPRDKRVWVNLGEMEEGVVTQSSGYCSFEWMHTGHRKEGT